MVSTWLHCVCLRPAALRRACSCACRAEGPGRGGVAQGLLESLGLCCRGWQIMGHRPNATCHLFLYSPRAKNRSYNFKWLEKKWFLRIIFCGMSKFDEIPISVFVNRVLLEHSQAHLFRHRLWLLPHRQAGLSGCHGEHAATRLKLLTSPFAGSPAHLCPPAPRPAAP